MSIIPLQTILTAIAAGENTAADVTQVAAETARIEYEHT